MRKRIWTLFLCLLVASIVSFSNVEAKFIGTDGGEVRAGKGCKFHVSAGTIGNPEAADDALENAGEILADLNNYLEHITEEHIKNVIEEIDKAKKHLAKKLYKQAYTTVKQALKQLEKIETEEMAEEIVEEMVEEVIEIEAEETAIEAKLEEIEVKLAEIDFTDKELSRLIAEAEDELDSLTAGAEDELFIAQEELGLNITVSSCSTDIKHQGKTYRFLVFKCGPSGTKFDPSAMLSIPFKHTCESDFMILHKSQSEPINLINLDYEIDDENEVVNFYIPGFPHYYFARR